MLCKGRAQPLDQALIPLQRRTSQWGIAFAKALGSTSRPPQVLPHSAALPLINSMPLMREEACSCVASACLSRLEALPLLGRNVCTPVGSRPLCRTFSLSSGRRYRTKSVAVRV